MEEFERKLPNLGEWGVWSVGRSGGFQAWG